MTALVAAAPAATRVAIPAMAVDVSLSHLENAKPAARIDQKPARPDRPFGGEPIQQAQGDPSHGQRPQKQKRNVQDQLFGHCRRSAMRLADRPADPSAARSAPEGALCRRRAPDHIRQCPRQNPCRQGSAHNDRSCHHPARPSRADANPTPAWQHANRAKT